MGALGILQQDRRLQPTTFQNAFNACSRIVSFRAVRRSGSRPDSARYPGFRPYWNRSSAHILPQRSWTLRQVALVLDERHLPCGYGLELPETKSSRAKLPLQDRNSLPGAGTTRFELRRGRVLLHGPIKILLAYIIVGPGE